MKILSLNKGFVNLPCEMALRANFSVKKLFHRVNPLQNFAKGEPRLVGNFTG